MVKIQKFLHFSTHHFPKHSESAWKSGKKVNFETLNHPRAHYVCTVFTHTLTKSETFLSMFSRKTLVCNDNEIEFVFFVNLSLCAINQVVVAQTTSMPQHLCVCHYEHTPASEDVYKTH